MSLVWTERIDVEEGRVRVTETPSGEVYVGLENEEERVWAGVLGGMVVGGGLRCSSSCSGPWPWRSLRWRWA